MHGVQLTLSRTAKTNLHHSDCACDHKNAHRATRQKTPQSTEWIIFSVNEFRSMVMVRGVSFELAIFHFSYFTVYFDSMHQIHLFEFYSGHRVCVS